MSQIFCVLLRFRTHSETHLCFCNLVMFCFVLIARRQTTTTSLGSQKIRYLVSVMRSMRTKYMFKKRDVHTTNAICLQLIQFESINARVKPEYVLCAMNLISYLHDLIEWGLNSSTLLIT